MITIGQIGFGAWGPNLFRNFTAIDNCEVKYLCDSDPQVIEGLDSKYPRLKAIADFSNMLDDPKVDAVVIATPAPSHYALAKKALLAGKHVFVEKPLALKVDEAEQLKSLAAQMKKKLMVGHLLLYHPAIEKLRDIGPSLLGDILYVYTQRLNLGKVRNTENVMWSLAPHDISVILHLLGELPEGVMASGGRFLQKDLEDIVFLNLKFSNGRLGNIHVSWLDPTKTRKMVVVGSKKMAIFDEIASHDKLTIYDKGVDINPTFTNYEEFLKLRFGKAEVISISTEEPLQRECRHFIDCIINDKEPLTNGENGLNVLKVLAAAQRSLDKGGMYELL